MIAQVIDIPAFNGNWKLWIGGITALLVLMIVGRFVQAFRNGAGLIDAWKAVIFGTNVPITKPTDTINTNKQ